MATQTFVTDLQAMNPTVVQVQHLNHNNTKSPVSSQSQVQKSQTATIIQPGQAHSGQQQQYIVTTSGAGAALAEQNQSSPETMAVQQQQQGGQVYPAHVQYVDGPDPSIYASTNGQIQNYQTDYGQTTVYNAASGTYYQTSGGQVGSTLPANMGTTIQTMQGHILTPQGGGTFLIQGGTMDGEGTPLTHTTRASPATDDLYNRSQEVQWLIDNYETADGVSLPRSTLYNHYLRHCQEQNLDPMNPASFGKLIRSVFLGLRTRRLGTRGNSKYHYYGIRIKANSMLNQFTDDQTMAMRQQPLYQQGKKFRPKMEGSDVGYGNPGTPSAAQEGPTTQQQQHQQFLGDASGAIPNFGEIDISTYPLPEGVSLDHIVIFQKMYREHAEAIVDVVVNLQFSLIEALWQGFWRNQSLDQSPDNDYERRLPRDKLHLMCKYEPIRKYVRKSDYAFYQALVEVLIPDVLRPIPSSLTQAIRNFAKSLENWLKGAMTGVPEEMTKTKLGAVGAFAQTLRRYTSLNHLAQAARAVLQNTSQINQMLTDLNRVDFVNVQEQACWVCQCEDGMVQQLEQDFKKTLQQQNSLEQWAIWLEGVVNQVLKPHEGSPGFPKAARQFLLKWSFYSSMVIRDLTLRSAASFGSFHLIRLLYDEYMFYLVEHKVASATGETPIAVMGEFMDLSSAVAMSFNETETSTMKISALNKAPATVTLAPANKATPGLVQATVNRTPLAATSLISKTNDNVAGSGATTLMVLTTSSSAAAGNQNGTMAAPMSAASMGTHLAVKTATTSGNLGGTKTIVVMPVSNTLAGGDVSMAKRFKLE